MLHDAVHCATRRAEDATAVETHGRTELQRGQRGEANQAEEAREGGEVGGRSASRCGLSSLTSDFRRCALKADERLDSGPNRDLRFRGDGRGPVRWRPRPWRRREGMGEVEWLIWLSNASSGHLRRGVDDRSSCLMAAPALPECRSGEGPARSLPYSAQSELVGIAVHRRIPDVTDRGGRGDSVDE